MAIVESNAEYRPFLVLTPSTISSIEFIIILYIIIIYYLVLNSLVYCRIIPKTQSIIFVISNYKKNMKICLKSENYNLRR